MGLIGLCMAWYVHAWPHLHTANESIRLYFIQAVVETGRPELDVITRLHGSVPVDRSEYGGHIYMDKAPGLSFAALPLYPLLRALHPEVRRADFWLLGYLGCLLVLVPSLLAALWAAGRWLLQVGERLEMTRITLLAIGLASPVFVYATLFFGHGMAAALVALAFFVLAGSPGDGPATMARRVVAGLCAGAAGFVDTPVFILAAMLCLYALARLPEATVRQRLQSALPFIAGVAAFSLLQLIYNAWVLGHPLRFTYHFKGDAQLAAIIDSGFFGFRPPSLEALGGTWLGARRGLLYHAPWLALAIAGHVQAAFGRDTPARLRRDARWLLGVSAVYALFVSGFVDWRAGDSVGARHLLPIVPLLGVGLGGGLRWLQGSTPDSLRRDAARGAAGLGVAIGVVMAALPVMTFPYHFEQIDFPVLELNLPLLLFFHGHSHSLGNAVGLGHGASALVFAALLTLPWALVWWAGRRGPQVAGSPPPAGRRAGTRAWASAALLAVLWSAAVVAPIAPPERAVQVARFKAAQLLKVPKRHRHAYRWLNPR